MGAERKSMIITDEEKKVTAYHEAGHALVAALLPHTDPLHKVTIIPRGMALGVTQQLPTEEKHNYTKEQLESRIAVCMGGRIAEDMTFGEISTGAANDIEQATEMARKMVCEWGMSEALGPLTYGKKEEQVFLGKEFNRHQDYSEATALQIDAEIKRIVTEQYERAQKTLTEKRPALVRVAEALLEVRGARRRAARSRSSRAGRWRIAGPAARAAAPPREGKMEHEGERAGGILPPLRAEADVVVIRGARAPHPRTRAAHGIVRRPSARGHGRRRGDGAPASRATGGGHTRTLTLRGGERVSSASGPGSWACST